MLPFADWLPRQRWYAGRHRRIQAVRPEAVTALPGMDHMLLHVTYVDGGSDRYQVFVRWGDPQPPAADRATGARIGETDADDRTGGGTRVGYDALYDESAAREILALIADDKTFGGVRFAAEPGVTLPVDAPARVSDAEQSNTSVVFDSA